MKKINPIEFVLYRLGLASDKEKKNIWSSKESDSMLSEKWNEAASDQDIYPNLEMPVLKADTSNYSWGKWGLAASVLLMVSLTLSYLQNNSKAETLTVVSGYGETKEVLLSDGSLIFLNSGSTLSYPSEFNTENRKVKFKGEAFFDIKSNPEKPFLVEMPNTVVKVLGTSFNCNTHSKNEIESVSLKTGKVNFIVDNKEYNLKPGERFEFNTVSKELTRKTIEASSIGNWQLGYLNFENSSIREIAKCLERKYDVNIEVGNEVGQNQKINLAIENESLTEILEILKLTAKIDYSTQTKGSIIITNPN